MGRIRQRGRRVNFFGERLAMASPPLTRYDYAQRKIIIEAKTPRQEESWWGLSIRALFGWVVAYRIRSERRNRNHRLLPASARTASHGQRVRLS